MNAKRNWKIIKKTFIEYGLIHENVLEKQAN